MNTEECIEQVKQDIALIKEYNIIDIEVYDAIREIEQLLQLLKVI